jgi:alpha-glucoside transport system permease protein
MTPALQGILTIVIGVGGCVAYFWASNLFVDKVLFPPRGPHAGRNITRANIIRPWLFLLPAILALGLYLAYPVVATLWLSLPAKPTAAPLWAGQLRADDVRGKFWESMRNNMLWLIVVPAHPRLSACWRRS